MNIATNNIYNCDCVEGMKKIETETIDMVITSPPYDNLRKYNGYEWDFEKTAEEIYRIVKRGGVVVWVVSDATIKGSETATAFRQALYFKKIGFNLHDTMIWIKDGGGAVGSNKCYTQNFEYMFVLSKGVPKTINLIYDKPNLSYGIDKSGIGRRKTDGTKKIEKRKAAKPFSRRNNWWYIPPQKGGKHPAVFPEQLANDHIITWSNEGDLILDPFCGSGTVAKMAMINNRKYLCFEISAEYCEFARKRVETAKREKEKIKNVNIF